MTRYNRTIQSPEAEQFFAGDVDLLRSNEEPVRTERGPTRESSSRCSVYFSILASAMVGAASVSAQPADGPHTRVRSYDLAGKATLLLSVPSDWKQEIRNAMTVSPTIVFTPRAGNDFQLLIKAIPNVNAPFLADPDKLRTLVKEHAWKLLPRSVEKDVNPVELKGQTAFGYSYTLREKAPRRGAFRLITGGTLLAGDYLVNFSLAHRDSETSLTAPLEALQSLEIKHAPSSTAKAEPILRVKSGR